MRIPVIVSSTHTHTHRGTGNPDIDINKAEGVALNLCCALFRVVDQVGSWFIPHGDTPIHTCLDMATNGSMANWLAPVVISKILSGSLLLAAPGQRPLRAEFLTSPGDAGNHIGKSVHPAKNQEAALRRAHLPGDGCGGLALKATGVSGGPTVKRVFELLLRVPLNPTHKAKALLLCHPASPNLSGQHTFLSLQCLGYCRALSPEIGSASPSSSTSPSISLVSVAVNQLIQEHCKNTTATFIYLPAPPALESSEEEELIGTRRGGGMLAFQQCPSVCIMAMFLPVRTEKIDRFRRDVNRCKELLQFESGNVDILTAEFLSVTDETRGGTLTSQKRIEILLRCMGDPEFQTDVAEDFVIDRTTPKGNFAYIITKSHSSDATHLVQTEQFPRVFFTWMNDTLIGTRRWRGFRNHVGVTHALDGPRTFAEAAQKISNQIHLSGNASLVQSIIAPPGAGDFVVLFRRTDKSIAERHSAVAYSKPTRDIKAIWSRKEYGADFIGGDTFPFTIWGRLRRQDYSLTRNPCGKMAEQNWPDLGISDPDLDQFWPCMIFPHGKKPSSLSQWHPAVTKFFESTSVAWCPLDPGAPGSSPPLSSLVAALYSSILQLNNMMGWINCLYIGKPVLEEDEVSLHSKKYIVVIFVCYIEHGIICKKSKLNVISYYLCSSVVMYLQIVPDCSGRVFCEVWFLRFVVRLKLFFKYHGYGFIYFCAIVNHVVFTIYIAGSDFFLVVPLSGRVTCHNLFLSSAASVT
uniref:Uncharacterized protein n=1 Tax=Timema bartmani TaxID=61472 RepID=A0A7R9I0Q3_9NEOP|nr:unnamed protein product [Timema bartmani]